MKASAIFTGLAAMISTVTAAPSPQSGKTKPLTGNVKQSDFRIDCNPGNLAGDKWRGASTLVLNEGISHLKNVGGSPGRPAWMCGRVSCQQDQAIFWCNETGKHKSLGSFTDIAIGTQALIDKCLEEIWGKNDATRYLVGSKLKASAHHPSGWKVEVRAAQCKPK